jgi:hypothetical protein
MEISSKLRERCPKLENIELVTNPKNFLIVMKDGTVYKSLWRSDLDTNGCICSRRCKMNLKEVVTLGALAATITFTGAVAAEAARAVVFGNPVVRSGPSQDYRAVGRLRSGDRVNITRCARSQRWCHVQSRHTRNGWVRSRYLDRISGSRPGPSTGICFFGRRGKICLNP